MDAVLHQPENASVLERSVFLNDLIYHKAISWSACSRTWKRRRRTTCASRRCTDHRFAQPGDAGYDGGVERAGGD